MTDMELHVLFKQWSVKETAVSLVVSCQYAASLFNFLLQTHEVILQNFWLPLRVVSWNQCWVFPIPVGLVLHYAHLLAELLQSPRHMFFLSGENLHKVWVVFICQSSSSPPSDSFPDLEPIHDSSLLSIMRLNLRVNFSIIFGTLYLVIPLI